MKDWKDEAEPRRAKRAKSAAPSPRLASNSKPDSATTEQKPRPSWNDDPAVTASGSPGWRRIVINPVSQNLFVFLLFFLTVVGVILLAVTLLYPNHRVPTAAICVQGYTDNQLAAEVSNVVHVHDVHYLLANQFADKDAKNVLDSNPSEMASGKVQQVSSWKEMKDKLVKILDDKFMSGGGPSTGVLSHEPNAILYLNLHLLVANDEPRLMFPDYEPLNSGSWTPFSELLGVIKAARKQEFAETRVVLILDCGKQPGVVEIGAFDTNLRTAIQSQLRKHGDDNLFVLLSHDDGERGWYAPELGGSVFSHAVSHALCGQTLAGKSNGQVVRLSEVAEYVRSTVSRWTGQHRGVAQNPVLITTSSKAKSDFPLMLPGKLTLPDSSGTVMNTSINNYTEALETWEKANADGTVLYRDPLLTGQIEHQLRFSDQLAIQGFNCSTVSVPTIQLENRLTETSLAASDRVESNQDKLVDEFVELLNRGLEEPTDEQKLISEGHDLRRRAAWQWILQKAQHSERVDESAISDAIKLIYPETADDSRHEDLQSQFLWMLREYAPWKIAPDVGRLVATAIRVRHRCEQMVFLCGEASGKQAGDLQIHYWLIDELNEIDDLRRQAEDLLFAGTKTAHTKAEEVYLSVTQQLEELMLLREEASKFHKNRADYLSQTPRVLSATERFSRLNLQQAPIFDLKYRAPAGHQRAGQVEPFLASCKAANDLAVGLSEYVAESRKHFEIDAIIDNASSNGEMPFGKLVKVIEFGLVAPKDRAAVLDRGLKLKVAEDVVDIFTRPIDQKSQNSLDRDHAATGVAASDALVNWLFAGAAEIDPESMNEVRFDPTMDAGEQYRKLARRVRKRIEELVRISSNDTLVDGTNAETVYEAAAKAELLVRLMSPLFPTIVANAEFEEGRAIWEKRRQMDRANLLCWQAFRVSRDFWGRDQVEQQSTSSWFEGTSKSLLKAAAVNASFNEWRGRNLGNELASLRDIEMNGPVTTSCSRNQISVYDGSSVEQSTEEVVATFVPDAKLNAFSNQGVVTATLGGSRRTLTLKKPLEFSEEIPINLRPKSMDAIAFYRGHFRSHQVRIEYLEEQRLIFREELPPQNTATIEVIGSSQEAPDVLFVLDCSGSMLTGMPGKDADGAALTRGKVCRRALKNALKVMSEQLPQNTRVGLMLYGHRCYFADKQGTIKFTKLGEADLNRDVLNPNTDSQLMLPMTRLNPAMAKINQILDRIENKKGASSPLYRSLNSGVQHLKDDTGRTRVIVVLTDGANHMSHPNFTGDISTTQVEEAIGAVDAPERLQRILVYALSGVESPGDKVKSLFTTTIEAKNSEAIETALLKSVGQRKWFLGNSTEAKFFQAPAETKISDGKEESVSLRVDKSDVRAEAKVEGGEALKFVFSQDAGQPKLEFAQEEIQGTMFKLAEIPEISVTSASVGRNLSYQNHVEFPITIQAWNGDRQVFTKRPHSFHAEIRAIDENNLPYGFWRRPPRKKSALPDKLTEFSVYHRRYIAGKQFPQLPLSAKPWTDELLRVEIDLWMRLKPLPKSLQEIYQFELKDSLQNFAPTGLGFTGDFSLSRQDDPDKRVVRVTLRRSGIQREQYNSIRYETNPLPIEVFRRYYTQPESVEEITFTLPEHAFNEAILSLTPVESYKSADGTFHVTAEKKFRVKYP